MQYCYNIEFTWTKLKQVVDVHSSDIPLTETQTDTEMININKTHTETNNKIFNTDTRPIYI